MRRLLSANLARLFRHRVFWICMAVTFLLGAYNFWVAGSYRDKGVLQYTLEQSAFSITPFGCFLMVFGVLFIGDEFAYGTIRNKIVAGYTRGQVYLSLLLTGSAAALLFYLTYAAATFAVGVPILGYFQGNMDRILYYAFCLALSMLALCAVLTLLAMLCHRRTAAAVLGILLATALLAAGAKLDSDLSEPEMIDRYIQIDINGKPLEVEKHPNPLYLKGTKREIYQWAEDILPSGQAIQIGNLSGDHPERWPLCSAAVFAVITGAGVWLFRRKDVN